MMEDYYKINKEAWNARTKIHLHSSFYDLGKFKREVKSVPDLDLSLLGDIRGKSIFCIFNAISVWIRFPCQSWEPMSWEWISRKRLYKRQSP